MKCREVLCGRRGRYPGGSRSIQQQNGNRGLYRSHFSQYAVGYSKVSFTDVSSGAWYHAPVTFCAARSITNGTSTTTFSPDAAVTRGQFIVMLMRAYGIEPDANPTGNFTDRITLTTSQRRKNSASRTASATICLRLKTKSAGRKCLRCSTVRSTN